MEVFLPEKELLHEVETVGDLVVLETVRGPEDVAQEVVWDQRGQVGALRETLVAGGMGLWASV